MGTTKGRRHRNKRILMDNLSGIPMAKIADMEGIDKSRVGQICMATLRNHHLHRSMGKQKIGAALARTHTGYADQDTPEGFWWEVERERQHSFFARLPRDDVRFDDLDV